MELKELTEKTKELFNAETGDLGSKIFETVMNNDVTVYEKFCDIVKDLSVDWLQMIYQYYYADRKEKMQDYTPKSLALFMGKLAGEADKITDHQRGTFWKI